MTVSSEILSSISTPEHLDSRLGALELVDGVPTDDTVEKVYDHLDSVHALNVFLDGYAGWFPILRLYSPLKPFFDKSWRPSEIESLV